MDKMDNLHVVIRVRPLINTEQTSNAAVHWQVRDNIIFQLDSDGQRKPPIYTFDRIFDTSATSVDVFDEVARPILDASLEGYNGTIFAYGQTSSGKTHTMMGTDINFGVIPRMAEALFQSIENMPSRKFLLRASYMEIYNEKVYDLLSESRQTLNVREDLDGQTFVENLTEDIIHSQKDLLKIMKKGENCRSYGSTNANEKSSRSHTIFRMIIESASLPADLEDDCMTGLSQEEDEAIVMVSHLNLVDLAGSERASQSGTTGNRLREGCAINTSLFTLRNVISKLSQADGQFINFRDSKLTRILQPSLGGNAKTSIICTVTPAMIEETHSTLKFASTAKTIKNQPKINEVLSEEALLKRYTKDIQRLKKQIQTNLHKDQEMKQMKLELQETSEKNQKLEQKLKLLQENIVTSSLRSPKTSLMNPNSRRLTWGGPRLPSVSSPTLASLLMPWDRANATPTGDGFLKSIHFEKLISDEKFRLSQDAECQVNILESTAQQMLKKALETKVKLKFKILELQEKLQDEILKAQNKADNTLMFVKEECICEIETLTSENEELKQKIVLMEKKMVDLSQTGDKQQKSSADCLVDKLTNELKDSEIKLEHHLKQSELLKTELRNELQNAYDYIERLEKCKACPDTSVIGAHIKENLNKSIHALTLDDEDNFSKFVKPWQDSPSRPGACGMDFDSEMQIVQMEFEHRESALLEDIAKKNARIIELENTMNTFENERLEASKQIENFKSTIVTMEKNRVPLEDIAARDVQITMLEGHLNESEKQCAELLKRLNDMALTIETTKENEQALTDELEKALVNSQEIKTSCELAMKEYEVKVSAMEQKIVELESKSYNRETNKASHDVDSQTSSASVCSEGPLDIPDMQKKIDDMQYLVEEFCKKEILYIDQLENLKKEQLNCEQGFDFQKHFRESHEYQEELQRKIEDLRSMIVLYKQKEQHVLDELESVKAELLHHQSLSLDVEMKKTTNEAEGDIIAFQGEKILALREVIQENRQKEERLVEKLDNLKSELRQRHVSLLSIDRDSLKDTVGELIEMQKNMEQLEAEIMEYKQMEEVLSTKLQCLQVNGKPNLYSTSNESRMQQTDKLEQPAIQPDINEGHALSKYTEMKDKLVNYENEVSAYIKKEACLMEEMDGLREQLLQKSQGLALNLQLKETLQTELEELRGKEQSTKNEPNLCDEIEKLNVQLKNSKEAAMEAELKVIKAEEKLSEIQIQMEELQNLKLRYECKEKQLLMDSQNLKADLQHYKDLSSENEMKISLAEAKSSELELRNEKLAETILQHACEEELHLQELENLKNECQLGKDRLQELENKVTELSSLLAEHADCSQREKKLRQYAQMLESDLKAKSEENFNHRELFNQLESSLNNEKRLKEALKEKDDELKQSQRQVLQYEEKMDTLNQQQYELKNEHGVLQTYLIELQEQETELVKKLELETNEKKNLQNQFELAKKKLIKDYEALNADYQDLQKVLDETKTRFHTMHPNPHVSCNDIAIATSPICQQPVVEQHTSTSTSTQCDLLPFASTEAKKQTKDVACGTSEHILQRTIKFTQGVQCDLLTIESPTARHSNSKVESSTLKHKDKASMPIEDVKVSTTKSIYDSQSMMSIIWKDSEEIQNHLLSADGTLTEDQMVILSEIQALKEDFNKLKTSFRMLKLKYSSACSENERNINLVKGIQNYGKCLEYELEMSRAELEMTKAELNEKVTRERGSSSARKNAIKQAHFEDVEKLNKLNEAYSKLKNKFNFLEQENENLMSDIKTMQEKSHENSESKRNAEQMVSSLRVQLENANERCEKLQKEIRRLSSLQNTSILTDIQKSTSQTMKSDSGVCSQNMEMYGNSGGRGSVTLFALESIQVEKVQLERKYQQLKRRSTEQQSVIHGYLQKFGKLKPESPKKAPTTTVVQNIQTKVIQADSSPMKTTRLNSPVKSESQHVVNAPAWPLTESGQTQSLPSNADSLDKVTESVPIDHDTSLNSWIRDNDKCKVS